MLRFLHPSLRFREVFVKGLIYDFDFSSILAFQQSANSGYFKVILLTGWPLFPIMGCNNRITTNHLQSLEQSL
jgi:hypothetical protein